MQKAKCNKSAQKRPNTKWKSIRIRIRIASAKKKKKTKKKKKKDFLGRVKSFLYPRHKSLNN